MICNRKLGIAAVCLAAFTTCANADPSGLWREKGGGTVRIGRCGAGYCAWIASVSPATDPATGKPRTDKNNVDPAKRDRPLVGIQVLFAMKPSGSKQWSGRLYDEDRGQTFTGNLVEVDANTVRIEGCGMGMCGGEALSRVR